MNSLTLFETQRNEESPPVSVQHIFTIMFKYKWMILLFFIGIVGSVTLGSLHTQNIYRASSKFIVEKEMDSEKALLLQINMPSQYEKYDWINSEVEILKSYPIALRVVETLELDKRHSSQDNGSQVDPQLSLERTIDAFQHKTDIEIAKNSNVIEISYEDPDPLLAMLVVDSMIKTYMAYRSELYDESETYTFFEEQMKIIDNKLRDLEHHQSEFKRNNEMISPEAQKTILLTRLADFEERLNEVRAKRRRKESLLSVIREQSQSRDGMNLSVLESEDNVVHSQYISKLRSELLDLELEREKMLQNYTSESTPIGNLDKQIAATNIKLATEMQHIVQMLEMSARVLASEENMLRQSIDNTSNEIRDLAKKEYEYSQISRGLEDNREIYSMLLKQREEARISLAKLQNGVSVKIISPAVVPIHPVNPRTKLKILIAIILGLIGGIGLAFLRHYLDRTVTFPEDIERYTGLPLLGSIRVFDNKLPEELAAHTAPELSEKSHPVEKIQDAWIT